MVGGEDEAAAFDGNVADGGEPGIAGVGGGGAINLDAHGIHGGAQQRQIIFPADDCANFSDVGIEYRKSGVVAESPDEALRSGRHNFAMFAEKCAVVGEEEHGAVERAAIAFDDADNENDFVFLRNSRATTWRSITYS